MSARDNVLFKADVTSGLTAGTVIPLSLLYGIENVRQGYGTPKLKSVKAFFDGCFSSYAEYKGIPIEIKNSNWIDSAGLSAQKFQTITSLNRDSLNFMRGRDKVLQPNTSWIINAVLDDATTTSGVIYVLLEIEYSDVAGINTDTASGSPVMKSCSNASVTGSASTPINIGSFDNLLQGVTYVLSEVSCNSGLASQGAFVIIEGFSNQKGLVRIIPIRSFGLAEQIEGSVYLTKQTYSVSVINVSALSSANVAVRLELIASQN